MNRNNFLIHLALAIVLILIAAFAGQLNRWRKEWKTHPDHSRQRKRNDPRRPRISLSRKHDLRPARTAGEVQTRRESHTDRTIDFGSPRSN